MHVPSLPLRVLFLAVIVAIVVAACGGGDEETAPAPTQAGPQPTATPAPRPTQAPPTATPTPVQPKRGGVVTMRTISPLQSTLNNHRFVNCGVFESMGASLNQIVQFDPYNSHQLSPDLAESWQVAPDGLSITFKVRKDVKWSDATPFTAKDIAFNVNRVALDPKYTSHLRTLYVNLSAIETPDDSTVVMRLKEPQYSFFANLGSFYFVQYPAHIPEEQFAKTPLATGGFKVTSINLTQSVELERNPGYFIAGRPYLDGLRVAVIPDHAAAAAAFRTHQVHVSDPCGSAQFAEQLEAIKKDVPNVQLDQIVSGRFGAQFGQRDPWLNQSVRQAVHLAADRQEMAAVGWGGYAIPSMGWFLPSSGGGQWGIPMADLDKMPGQRQPKTEDVARAKQLLKDAGIDPSKVSFTIATQNLYEKPATVFAEQIRRLGFNVQMDVVEIAVHQERERSGNFSIDFQAQGVQFDEPAISSPWFLSKGTRNNPKWASAKVDQLWSEVDRQFDVAKRKQLVRDLEQELINFAAEVTVGWTAGLWGWWPEVKNVPDAISVLYNNYRFDRVWLDR